MESTQPYRIIISGGGTGGHIYPAIAIANTLKQINQDIEILFVGARGKMEMQKVPEAGYRIEGLSITGLQRRLSLGNLLFPFKLLASILKAGGILKRFKPHVVVGFGGYASGPILYAATRRRIPTLIQEQNGYAGLANKWLAPKVKTICVAYENMERFFPKDKLVLTGNPVRAQLMEVHSLRQQALDFFNLDAHKATILVFGGSLGARTINQSLLGKLQQFREQQVQVIWQTGKLYYQEIKNKLADTDQSDLRVLEFIKEMDLAYAAADVVISRAGALSIAELCLTGKPVILVPSPNVAEDHQTKNAQALVDSQAALLIKDHEAPHKLVTEAISLVQDREKQKILSKNISKMARPQAARHIANEVLKLAS
ncbi:MAG: undecaprenyldiphospho-muramoylpentapeptide beta-N-acetylglucosaminyltransferase [Cyclobacteriaceae bacterium]|nr:undecaprenyldiphospho-muramoylpentapeptide beta-N-acetylglucosaminyltransferase [Cyclobacteriaceae bacterium]